MAASKLDRARRERSASPTALAVAAAVQRPANTAVTDDKAIAKNMTLPMSMHIAGDEKLLELKRLGISLSWSALVEIALNELFTRPDIADVVAKYGRGYRRK